MVLRKSMLIQNLYLNSIFLAIYLVMPRKDRRTTNHKDSDLPTKGEITHEKPVRILDPEKFL